MKKELLLSLKKQYKFLASNFIFRTQTHNVPNFIWLPNIPIIFSILLKIKLNV